MSFVRRFLHRHLISLIILSVVIASALLAAVWTVPTTFSLNAESQWIELEVDRTMPPWFLPRVKITGGLDPKEKDRTLTGKLFFSEDSRLRLERIGQRPMRLLVEATRKVASIGRFERDGLPPKILGPRVTMEIEANNSGSKGRSDVVLPFDGKFSLKDLSRFRSGDPIPLFQSGSLTLIGKPIFSVDLYEAGKVELRAGDSIEVKNPTGPTVGLIYFWDHANLQISLRVVGDEIRVSRFGSQGFSSRNTFLLRITHDPFITSPWTAFVIVIGFLRFKKDEKAK